MIEKCGMYTIPSILFLFSFLKSFLLCKCNARAYSSFVFNSCIFLLLFLLSWGAKFLNTESVPATANLLLIVNCSLFPFTISGVNAVECYFCCHFKPHGSKFSTTSFIFGPPSQNSIFYQSESGANEHRPFLASSSFRKRNQTHKYLISHFGQL